MNANAYWSPGHYQQEQQGQNQHSGLSVNAPEFSQGQNQNQRSGLSINAPEFSQGQNQHPGLSVNAPEFSFPKPTAPAVTTADASQASADGINASAQAFVPGRSSTASPAAAPEFVPQHLRQDPQPSIQGEEMQLPPEFVPGNGYVPEGEYSQYGDDVNFDAHQEGGFNEEEVLPVDAGGATYYVGERDQFIAMENDPASVDWTDGTVHAGQSGGLDTRLYAQRQGANTHRGRADDSRVVGGDEDQERPSFSVPVHRSGQPSPSLQMSAALRLHLHARDLALLRRLPPDDERHKELPLEYHNMYPLDHPQKSRTASGSYGYASAVFKVRSKTDGVAYALRRVDNVRATQRIAQAAQDRWTKQCPPHPNLVRLEKCFMDKNKALFFVHAYWPTSQTLVERYVYLYDIVLSGSRTELLFFLVCQ